MTPDDPRHGRRPGYIAGCREECCRTAQARYQNLWLMDRNHGVPRTMPAQGVRRRVQALWAMGWTQVEVARRCGHSIQWLHEAMSCDTVRRATHDAVAAVYDELSMTLPPETTPAERFRAQRARGMAGKRGYAPPLAWDDIDNDPAPYRDRTRGLSHSDVDPVVVDRILDGHVMPSATAGERRLALSRWLARGGSERSLCQAQDWREGRYTTPKEAA